MNSVMEIFSQYDRHNIFKIFTDGKKSYRRKLSKLNHKVATSSLVMFACFPFK